MEDFNETWAGNMLVRLTAGSVFSLPDEVRVRVKLTLNGPYMDLTWTLHGPYMASKLLTRNVP